MGSEELGGRDIWRQGIVEGGRGQNWGAKSEEEGIYRGSVAEGGRG